MPKMLLPDINVWLALAFDGHVHHPAAKQWFDALTTEVCLFCRLTQQGFLRLASNPAVFKEDALTLADAWQKFDLLLTDPRVSFANEPADIERHWRAFTERRTYSPHVWNDAYLAAFALCENLELVTLDQGMSQYRPAICTVLR
ncbi:MAG: PIN domain-containing protein [Acidobacteriales bacterium]|nr:PIN domain-containing protein [Terriglobales bacterium]